MSDEELDKQFNFEIGKIDKIGKIIFIFAVMMVLTFYGIVFIYGDFNEVCENKCIEAGYDSGMRNDGYGCTCLIDDDPLAHIIVNESYNIQNVG